MNFNIRNFKPESEEKQLTSPNIDNLYLPQELHKHPLEHGLHEIESAIKQASRAPERPLYPSGIEPKLVQKVYMHVGRVQFEDPYSTGNKYSYVAIPAICQAFYHKYRPVVYDGCPFIFWMPFMSLHMMLMRGARVELHKFVSKNPNQWIEVHFVKKTERDYELLFFGLSTYLGCEEDELNRPVHKFATERIVFQSTRYTDADRDGKKRLKRLEKQ